MIRRLADHVTKTRNPLDDIALVLVLAITLAAIPLGLTLAIVLDLPIH